MYCICCSPHLRLSFSLVRKSHVGPSFLPFVMAESHARLRSLHLISIRRTRNSEIPVFKLASSGVVLLSTTQSQMKSVRDRKLRLANDQSEAKIIDLACTSLQLELGHRNEKDESISIKRLHFWSIQLSAFFFICINCDVFSIQFFLPVWLPIVLCIALLIAANLAVCSVECRQPCVLGTKPQVSLVVIGRNVPLLHLCTPLCCEGLEHLKTCALESLYGLNEQREILSEVSFRIL